MIKLLCGLLVLCLSLGACTDPTQEKAGKSKSFTVKGVVLEIQDEGRTVIIDHEAMPGYMGAMTMPFRLKNPEEAAKIAPGDEIQFTYQVEKLSSWVENLTPTGRKVEIKQQPAKSDQSSNLLKEGDPFPDFALTDEQGQAVQLNDYRGSVVALTFVFTRCPVPEYCPAMMRNFQEVDARLKDDPDAPHNYQLLTVSFDSEFDTPEVLQAYGKAYKKDSAHWNLLTSRNQSSIKTLGAAVGLKFDTSNTGIYAHNLRTVVLDGTGRITRIFTDETWKPQSLVDEIKRAAADCCVDE